MNNRIPRPLINVPKRYRQKDFFDVIEDLQKKTVSIDDGLLTLKMITNEVKFNKFGKLFKAHISIFMGQTEITVEEV